MHMQRERTTVFELYQVKQMFTHRDPSWKTPFSLLASASLESHKLWVNFGKFYPYPFYIQTFHRTLTWLCVGRLTDVTRFLFLYKVNAPDAWTPATPVVPSPSKSQSPACCAPVGTECSTVYFQRTNGYLVLVLETVFSTLN
jgi:hypothetical protein